MEDVYDHFSSTVFAFVLAKEADLMSLFETDETDQYTFEPVTLHPFYAEINRSLVRQALISFTKRPSGDTLSIVDMACGTGVITRLIAEELVRLRLRGRILCVDPSAEALRLAQKSMQEVDVMADFIQGDADDLSSIVQNADAAFFCNAIHLVSDKLSAFRQMKAILAPGGIFSCNSAFFDGTNVGETQRFARLWIRKAVGWLRKEQPEVMLSRETKTVAMQWLNPEEYSTLLKDSGFKDIEITLEKTFISLDALRDLGKYWLFIAGALPGIPLPLGADALGISVYQAGEELGLAGIDRMWLQMLARKE
jgi:ubiquinone/menaquinone biosynthesis C-methylase UbiE